ncbi:MAG: glycosyltransferase family 4 protein [Bacteroidales bacterium]|jgi:glycosyltransferase involved in cell wall biosynthesis|nr:glycosyltransferase family 4 protein [Bacteroidales bacterium]
MKIVSIVPGFGGTFYCGNCLRDSAFVAALRQEGHDAVILPVYLPLSLDRDSNVTDVPVFYGAVNIYLKQQFPFMRNIPNWMEHLLNSQSILKLAAKKSGSTRAHGLEELTKSMLLGKEGFQRNELQELVNFLKDYEKPDVVHFSNALLLGMAAQIKEETGVPVVCSLQDEDIWVDAMDPANREEIWQLMAGKGREVDAFVSVSHYFAAFMKEKMKIPVEKLHVIPIGVKPEDYSFNLPASNPPAIGFLSRMCPENGFEILVDAFIRLKSNRKFNNVKLYITGGMTGDDRLFFHRQMNKLKKKNILSDVHIFHDFTAKSLSGFFRSITVLSVPVLKGEAFGLYQIEAMASGIPIVQPALGAFSEIVETSGGGVLYQPNTPEALTEKLEEVLSNKETLHWMSYAGRKSVEEKFNCRTLTGEMVKVYTRIIQDKNQTEHQT